MGFGIWVWYNDGSQNHTFRGIEMVEILKYTFSIPVQIFWRHPHPPPPGLGPGLGKLHFFFVDIMYEVTTGNGTLTPKSSLLNCNTNDDFYKLLCYSSESLTKFHDFHSIRIDCIITWFCFSLQTDYDYYRIVIYNDKPSQWPYIRQNEDKLVSCYVHI